MTTLRDIGEDALIARLVSLAPRDPSQPAAGPGDDCAVIDHGGPTLLLLKTDAIAEHVHFLPDAAPRAVGWKAAARVVSDFAAMGGQPEHFLITLALPPEMAVAWVENLYRGLADCMAKFGGYLAGGETIALPAGSPAVISISASGSVARENLVLRSTARIGDVLLVTGTLGGSLAGKHLDFTPRLREAQWLVRHCKPTAMMDLSDGLGKDLRRLAAASDCGISLDRNEIPVTSGCTVAQALGDGEDFELLLAMDPARTDELLAAWPFPETPLTRIGHLMAKDAGEKLTGGWEHFSA